jgi:tetratricopeptide (TPR) repeat protein
MRIMQHTSRKIIYAGGLCLFLLAAQVSLISCAGPDRARSAAGREMRGDPALQPEESLRRLASREQQATNLRPIAAAIPPGIEPEALAPRSDADNRAFLSLEQALRELVAAHHPEAGDNGAAADGQSNDEPAADEADPTQESAVDDASTHTEALRHYTRGRQAMLEERLYVAITELQQAAQLDPDSPRIRRELARAYLAMNNQSRAMEQYAALRQIEPDDAEAVFSIGLYAANRREFETAAAILGRRLLSDEPFDHDPAADILARYTIAFSLRHLGYDRSFVQLWTLEAAELPMTGELFERTMYAARLGSIYRQRAELWRSVGDAHCRLGEYRRALDAYAISASLPSPDPAALHPRVIYANLRLGRVHSAQYELLAAINTEDGSISERDIRLCAYLTDTITAEVADHRRSARAEWPLRLLGDHVRRRYERSPDDPALARAAAALLPPAEGRRVLAEFVDRRPRDLDVVASLLAWLGARDLDSAIELTVDMVEANPDLTGQYVNRLIFEVPDPVSVLESLDQRQMHAPMERIGGDMAHSVQSRDLALAHVKARVLATLGAVGEAWQITETYRPQCAN